MYETWPKHRKFTFVGHSAFISIVKTVSIPVKYSIVKNFSRCVELCMIPNGQMVPKNKHIVILLELILYAFLFQKITKDFYPIVLSEPFSHFLNEMVG